MSPESWALVGVVVGAVLGGVAQLVSDALRRQHERQSDTRTARRDVYVVWIRLLHQIELQVSTAVGETAEQLHMIEKRHAWAFESAKEGEDAIEALVNSTDARQAAIGRGMRRMLSTYKWLLTLVLKRILNLTPSHRSAQAKRTRILDLVEILSTEQASLRLVAPDDTYEAGVAARTAAQVIRVDWARQDRAWTEMLEESRDRFFACRDDFVRLAKRDLGID